MACASLISCASTHDLASGPNHFGGGILEFEIADGIYRVVAKTNFAPWENLEGARSSWRSRAQTLCRPEGYKEYEVREYSYDHVPPIGFIRYIVTAREAYAVCNRLGVSDETALAMIKKSKN